MPRAPRIEFENACYHIMARGNRREPIVFGDDDRKLFVKTLSEAATRYHWRIFAWVLMDNHYHFVLRTPKKYQGRVVYFEYHTHKGVSILHFLRAFRNLRQTFGFLPIQSMTGGTATFAMPRPSRKSANVHSEPMESRNNPTTPSFFALLNQSRDSA